MRGSTKKSQELLDTPETLEEKAVFDCHRNKPLTLPPDKKSHFPLRVVRGTVGS